MAREKKEKDEATASSVYAVDDLSWIDPNAENLTEAVQEPLRPGVVVQMGEEGGRYEIVRMLGRGGMAEVFLARCIGADGFIREVVIKRLVDQLLVTNSKSLREEAFLLSKLRHPNIADPIVLGRSGDAYYFVMEYVEGVSLKSVLKAARRRGKRPSEGFCCYVASTIADALHYAYHKKDDEQKPLGIVHRDVKPSNVMVGTFGQVKLLDFGIAFSNRTERDRTQTGTTKGTVYYMCPEYLNGETPNGRSDLFSLTTLFIEILTGKLVFDDPNYGRVISMIMACEEAKVLAATRELSTPLREFCLKGMAKDPRDRFANGEEYGDALRDYMRQQSLIYGATDCVRELREIEAIGREGTKRSAQTVGGGVVSPAQEQSIADLTGTSSEQKTADTPSSPTNEERPTFTATGDTAMLEHEQVKRKNGLRRFLVSRIAVTATVFGVGAVLGIGAVLWVVDHAKGRTEGIGSPIEAAVQPPQNPPVEEVIQPRSEAPPEQKETEQREAQPKGVGSNPAQTGEVVPREASKSPLTTDAPIVVATRRTGSKRPSGTGRATVAKKADPPPQYRITEPAVAIGFADRPQGSASGTLARGTLIHAALRTPVDITTRGSVRAVVTRDVTGSGGLQVAKGSEVTCTVSGGSNSRATMSCDRVDANGRLLTFSGLVVGSDQSVGLPVGATGTAPAGTPFVVYVNASALLR